MNIPNLLTVFRLILIPVFVIVFNSSHEHRVPLAIAVFILAGLTDLLDGYIARKYNLITRLGTLLDPMADKLMLVTVLICMALQNYFPVWVVAVVIIKEAAMISGGAFLYCSKNNIVIPANRFGKAATAGFYLAIILLSISGGGLIGRIAMYLALILTAAAFLNYRTVALREMKKASKS